MRQMKKLIRAAMLLSCIGVVFCFAGCGAEDAFLKVQIEDLVQQHMREQDEVMKLYDIDKCQNFVIASETNGVRKGTVELGLKNKRTGGRQTVAYEFSYNVKKEFASVGVRNPIDVVRMMNPEIE